jgi:VanZ family protein
VALWCGVIYFFSSVPDLSTGLGGWDLILRKAAHTVEFGFLAALVWRALGGTAPWGVRRLFWATFLFCTAYAASDEFHQGFVPGRYPEVADVALDSFGAILVCLWQKRTGKDVFAWAWSLRRGAAALAAALLVFSTGCSRIDLFRADAARRQGRYEDAVKAYVRVAERHEGSGAAPAALYKAGRLASDLLGDQALARKLYRQILDRYGDRKGWGPRAELALFNTPNYFPLTDGATWEEGDSETKGRNARIVITCRPVEEDPTAARLARQYYAGSTYVKNLSVSNVYRKKGAELHEHPSGPKGTPVLLLRHPFEKGQKWTSKRVGRTSSFVIDGTADVKVAAGEFKDCLVVREQPEGVTGSWQVNYYAPGVGRVLTSLASGSSERRNTELLSYNLGRGREIGAGDD